MGNEGRRLQRTTDNEIRRLQQIITCAEMGNERRRLDNEIRRLQQTTIRDENEYRRMYLIYILGLVYQALAENEPRPRSQ